MLYSRCTARVWQNLVGTPEEGCVSSDKQIINDAGCLGLSQLPAGCGYVPCGFASVPMFICLLCFWMGCKYIGTVMHGVCESGAAQCSPSDMLHCKNPGKLALKGCCGVGTGVVDENAACQGKLSCCNRLLQQHDTVAIPQEGCPWVQSGSAGTKLGLSVMTQNADNCFCYFPPLGKSAQEVKVKKA